MGIVKWRASFYNKILDNRRLYDYILEIEQILPLLEIWTWKLMAPMVNGIRWCFYCVLSLIKTIYYKGYSVRDHLIILCLLILIYLLQKQLQIVHAAVIQPVIKCSYFWLNENSCLTSEPKLITSRLELSNRKCQVLCSRDLGYGAFCLYLHKIASVRWGYFSIPF